MKRLILSFIVVLVFAVSGVQSQDNSIRNKQDSANLPASISPSANPELWLYLQQQKRYDDPKQIVRQKAEFRAAQRQARIATRKWFGYSNARPIVMHVPQMGTYSSMWGGSFGNPYMWYGGGSPATAFYVDRLRSLR